MQRFDFSSHEYIQLLEKCPFTGEELKIIEMKRHGESNVAIAIYLNISERTLSRRLKSISRKILKEI